MNTREVALTAAGALFGRRDVSAVDVHVAPTYRQHSIMFKDGRDGLRELIGSLGPDFRYEPRRVLVDGDVVGLHGVYHGFLPEPQAAFDILRVEDGRLAEHWDAVVPVQPPNASGRSQLDGDVVITDQEHTERNRGLALRFIEEVLIGCSVDGIGAFVGPEYREHDARGADGVDALHERLARESASGIARHRLHEVIADGNFVMTLAEGRVGSRTNAFWDLFRFDEGRIVEHWDITQEIPDELPHHNGAFSGRRS